MSKYVEYGDEKISTKEALERMEEEIGELQEEIDKYVKIIDKIKEYIKLERKVCLGLNNKFGVSICDKVNKLLEEIK